jgi:hypothetical protein
LGSSPRTVLIGLVGSILTCTCVLACTDDDTTVTSPDADGGGDGGGDGGDLDATNPPEPDGGSLNRDSGSGPAPCKPRKCAAAGGANCGPVGDGCGGLLQCGTCATPETCGGGGNASVCGGSTNCTPKKCSDFPDVDGGVGACGPIADGCGGLVTCGTCTPPQSCGGGGVPSTCGGTTGCIPKTIAACTATGTTCGPIADGCGGVVDCGTCSVTQQCGAAGPGKCGTPPAVDAGGCAPKTCAMQGIGCGPAGDGCGGLLDCNVAGGCAPPQTCGGGGTPSVCGGSSACVAKTCAQIGATCGPAGDGCGGTLDCDVGGGCAPPQTCGGGGTPSACGGANLCVKKTCADYPANNSCGPLADGCGSTITCGGACTGGNICGGGGVPSVCGGAPGGGLCPSGSDGTVCRAAAGPCDVAEVCANGACPADVLVAAAQDSTCTPYACDGNVANCMTSCGGTWHCATGYGCSERTPNKLGTCKPAKYVFVTSTEFNASFGGLTGADGICAARATAALLTGTYLAWLSTAAGSPSTRFTRHAGPYVQLNGTLVAESYTDLTDGSLAFSAFGDGIQIAETGTYPANGPVDPDKHYVWTATNTDGTPDSVAANTSCAGFTSASASFTAGIGDWHIDFQWTDRGAVPCNVNARLYCFEQ